MKILSFIKSAFKAGIKKRGAMLLAAALIVSSVPAFAINVTGKAAIAIDYATGYTIYEKNADERRVPASMTKMMTLYVFFSEMKSHGLTLDSPVQISENAARLSVDSGLSNVRLIQGQSYTVNSLITSVCTVSACAAAVALAEAVSGTEEAFVELMNEYAAKLGLNAHFSDSYGISESNYITARSMAALARKIIMDYPQILTYTSMTRLTWDGKTSVSTNKFLPGMSLQYPGVDGLKTGTTDMAGCCMTATGVKDGRRIITVVMGSGNDSQRFSDSKALLDYGFANYSQSVKNFYAIDCKLTSPEYITAGDAFTVSAEMSGVVIPTYQKGEWLVNGKSVSDPEDNGAWIEDGSTSLLYYDLGDGYEGDSVNIAFRLFTPADSILFEKTVPVEHKYAPVAMAGANLVLCGEPVENSGRYPFIDYNGLTYMPLTSDNCMLMGFTGGWSSETGLELNPARVTGKYIPVEGECGKMRAEIAEEGEPLLTVSGREVTGTEDYPLLVFDGIIYFPLLSDVATEVFGLGLGWDEASRTLYVNRTR